MHNPGTSIISFEADGNIVRSRSASTDNIAPDRVVVVVNSASSTPNYRERMSVEVNGMLYNMSVSFYVYPRATAYRRTRCASGNIDLNHRVEWETVNRACGKERLRRGGAAEDLKQDGNFRRNERDIVNSERAAGQCNIKRQRYNGTIGILCTDRGAWSSRICERVKLRFIQSEQTCCLRCCRICDYRGHVAKDSRVHTAGETARATDIGERTNPVVGRLLVSHQNE